MVGEQSEGGAPAGGDEGEAEVGTFSGEVVDEGRGIATADD